MFYKKAPFLFNALAGLLLIILSTRALAGALTISDVATDHQIIAPGQAVSVSFTISQNASVTFSIYDARNYLVRELSSGKLFNTGRQRVSWDGLSRDGKTVPPGFYRYTITAIDHNGMKVVHDLSDVTGGETIQIDNVRYDSDNERVYYRVPNTSRIFLRVGVEDAFVAKTLLNGVVRTAGEYSIPWDGWDKSHAINLKHHTKLRFHGDGYRPSRNTIVVSASEQINVESHWLPMPQNLETQRQVGKKRKGLNIHAYHQVEHCRDVNVTLTLPDSLPNENGIPVISSAVSLRVSLSKPDTLRMEAERGEVVFFLDNQLIYENEASFFPYTWTWNKITAHEGVHYLTGFVLGFENHFGVSTSKVKLKN